MNNMIIYWIIYLLSIPITYILAKKIVTKDYKSWTLKDRVFNIAFSTLSLFYLIITFLIYLPDFWPKNYDKEASW